MVFCEQKLSKNLILYIINNIYLFTNKNLVNINKEENSMRKNDYLFIFNCKEIIDKFKTTQKYLLIIFIKIIIFQYFYISVSSNIRKI